MDKSLEALEREARAAPDELDKARAYAEALSESGWTCKDKSIEAWLAEH